MTDKDTSGNNQKPIKTAGIYTTYRIHYYADNPPVFFFGARNGDDSGNPSKMDIYNKRSFRCAFYSYEELPRDEIKILIHIALETRVGFGHQYLENTKSITYYSPKEYDCINHHYITELFLFPAMDRPYDGNSMISRLVYNEIVRKKLLAVKNALKKLSGPYYYRYIKIRRLYDEMFNVIKYTNVIKSIVVYNTKETKNHESDLIKNTDCEFLTLSGFPGDVEYPHTMDIVYMQHDDNISYHFTEKYKERYISQRKKIDSEKKLKFKTASAYNLPMKAIKILWILAVTYPINIIASPLMWIIILISFFVLTFSCFVFEKDKVSYVRHGYLVKHTSRTCSRGIWSYCKIVEYGTFRHFGMKYIYFSKKHMTDDEFRKLKRKIVPYDYDSIALPYKKDYMKIAENLLFAERKDR